MEDIVKRLEELGLPAQASNEIENLVKVVISLERNKFAAAVQAAEQERDEAKSNAGEARLAFELAQQEVDLAYGKGLEEGKKKVYNPFKLMNSSAKKPDSYASNKDIRAYLDTWECYKRAVGLDENTAQNVFLTYLGEEAQAKVREELRRTEVRGWEEFKQLVIQKLAPKELPILAKRNLESLKQEDGESVQDFGYRLLRKADPLFAKAEENEKETSLKKAFWFGLKNEELAERLTAKLEKLTFAELTEEAGQKDLILGARRRRVLEDNDMAEKSG